MKWKLPTDGNYLTNKQGIALSSLPGNKNAFFLIA
jgi:hypothetical protein